jgi:hypothetical protein
MARDFFDPSPEEQRVILIDDAILRKAERVIESCEAYNPEAAEIPLDNALKLPENCLRPFADGHNTL